MEVGLMDIAPFRERVAQVREEERELARLREEAMIKQAQEREEALAQKAQAEKEALAQKAQAEKEKELLSTFRQMVVDTVDVRFPALLRLAKKAVKTTTSHDELRQVHRGLMVAPDVTSAEDLLDALGEETATA
jgi:regulator of protease activity HflC (stomatin/prohibitin superfamily)